MSLYLSVNPSATHVCVRRLPCEWFKSATVRICIETFVSACPLVAEWCQPPSPTKVKALVSQSTLAVRSFSLSPNLTEPADSDPLESASIPYTVGYGEYNPKNLGCEVRETK